MTLATSHPATRPGFGNTRLSRFLADSFEGSRFLSLNAVLMLAGFALAMVLMTIDSRTLIGANVWHKPAKFFFSLSMQMATVAWALSLVPESVRRQRSVQWASVAMATASWLELAYIVYRASRGEASHFNITSVFAQVAYTLMGIGAFVITASAGWVGVVIWRNREGKLWREAAAIGLVLGAALGTFAGFYLGSRETGHWVGGEMTDLNGLRLFLWSTTGGDLRIAHFVGLHAMQLVPFAALSGRRSVVWAMAAAVTLATAAVFLQALMGIPLFRL